jgi:antitoxin VapB
MLAIPAETETLARLVARKTGKTPEEVVRDAVAATARTLGVVSNDNSAADQQVMIDAATAIVGRFAGQPILDSRDEDEILGYDHDGIPR